LTRRPANIAWATRWILPLCLRRSVDFDVVIVDYDRDRKHPADLVPRPKLGNTAVADPIDVELRVSTDGTLANSLPLLTLDDVRLPVRAGHGLVTRNRNSTC